MSRRRATVRTTHASPRVASLVAGAVGPDNTESMTTRVADRVVETTIERETTGGLHSSVDDYVVNLTVADRLAVGTDGGRDTAETADADTTQTADTTATTETSTTETRTGQTTDHTDTPHDNHE